jgi:hypothetical protein
MRLADVLSPWGAVATVSGAADIAGSVAGDRAATSTTRRKATGGQSCYQQMRNNPRPLPLSSVS